MPDDALRALERAARAAPGDPAAAAAYARALDRAGVAFDLAAARVSVEARGHPVITADETTLRRHAPDGRVLAQAAIWRADRVVFEGERALVVTSQGGAPAVAAASPPHALGMWVSWLFGFGVPPAPAAALAPPSPRAPRDSLSAFDGVQLGRRLWGHELAGTIDHLAAWDGLAVTVRGRWIIEAWDVESGAPRGVVRLPPNPGGGPAPRGFPLEHGVTLAHDPTTGTALCALTCTWYDPAGSSLSAEGSTHVGEVDLRAGGVRWFTSFHVEGGCPDVTLLPAGPDLVVVDLPSVGLLAIERAVGRVRWRNDSLGRRAVGWTGRTLLQASVVEGRLAVHTVDPATGAHGPTAVHPLPSSGAAPSWSRPRFARTAAGVRVELDDGPRLVRVEWP